MYDIRDGRLFVDTGGDDLTDLCNEVRVDCKTINTLTHAEKAKISVPMPHGDSSITVSRSELYNHHTLIAKLVDIGLSLIKVEENAVALAAALFEMDEEASVSYVHHKLGFYSINGRMVFLADRIIGGNSEAERCSRFEDEDIKACDGSFAAWRAMCLKNVSHLPFALGIALGAVAPLSYLMLKEGAITEVQIYALVAGTSHGKTAIMNVIASMWPSGPNLMQGFFATDNAFYGKLAEISGVPYLADEATVAETKGFNFSDLIYSLPTGKSKLRCNSDGTVKKPSKFSGPIIISSENSLLDKCTKEFGGQEMRILEFKDIFWFETGDLADDAKAVAFSNYGHAGCLIVELLLSDGFLEKTKKRFSKVYHRLLGVPNTVTNIKHRLLKRVALILTAAWVAEKALKIGLHKRALEAFLLDVVSDKAETTVSTESEAEKLLSFIVGEVLKNNSRFPAVSQMHDKKVVASLGDVWGAKEISSNTSLIWITPKVFEDFVKGYGIGKKSAIKSLYNAGFLKRVSTGHYLFKRSDWPIQASCYCLEIPKVPDISTQLKAFKPSERTIDGLNEKLVFDDSIPSDNALLAGKKADVMIVGFVRTDSSEIKMVLSKELVKALEIKKDTEVYIIPVPSAGRLLISKEKITLDALSIDVTLEGGQGIADSPVIGAMLKLFLKKPLQEWQRMAIYDTFIERLREPVLILNFENDDFTLVDAVNSANEHLIDVLYDRKKRREEAFYEKFFGPGESD